MRKFTHVLLLLLIANSVFSRSSRKELLSAGYAVSQQDPRVERSNRAKRAFPVADINEPDDVESVAGRTRKAKRQRYDTGTLVVPKPAVWVAEGVVTSEGYFDFPTLPVAESDIILIATVSSSEAHVSANRRGVFSEFNLVVEAVLKTSSQDIKEGSLLTADRIGGYVKYPNGQQVLFRIGGVYMPQVGSRYLFFLSTKRKPEFTIMTAYELTNEGVLALDLTTEFLSLDGISETDLLKRVRDLLTR